MVQIMVTNGGPHPADKWADITTNDLLDLIKIDDALETPTAIAARQSKRDVRAPLFAAILAAHQAVQDGERAALKKKGNARIVEKLDPTPYITPAVKSIAAVFVGTPFEAHFAMDNVQAIIGRMIGQHMATSMHIERSYQADKNPDSKEAIAFRAKHHGETVTEGA